MICIVEDCEDKESIIKNVRGTYVFNSVTKENTYKKGAPSHSRLTCFLEWGTQKWNGGERKAIIKAIINMISTI